MSRLRVLVLGGGFGGLELATTLCERAPDRLDVLLVDRAEGFVFGFSKLDMMFRQVPVEHVVHSYADLARPGLTFVRATVLEIDPAGRRVLTTAGLLEGDLLVIALGAEVHPESTPGLAEGGHEFYSVDGAARAAVALREFAGGHVVVGVTSTPFKCPPAPSETALLLHDNLTSRGVRATSDVSLVMPLPVPIPPSPDASTMVLAELAERGISWHPGRLVREVDAAGRRLVLDDGSTLLYDLFLAIPTHRAPHVVVDAGLTVDGWISVDPQTLATAVPDVYAIGDVTSVGTPKAGVFAEGQAAVVAEQILARLDGRPAETAYDGHGICWMEVGGGRIAKVDVTFQPGVRPAGSMVGPSADLAVDKRDFGASRAARWFGSTWEPVPR